MSESKRIWATLDPFFEPGPVLGRKVANTKFLRALLAVDPCDEYRFFLGDAGQADGLRAHVRKIAPDMLDAGRVRVLDRRELPRLLATEPVHCMHLSDCITSQPHAAALRNRYSRDIFPITGTIHSLSYSTFGTQFLRHLWAGTTRRDAIVCTSEPGREAVQRFFDWLRQGYGLDPEHFPAPQLARIPLAVDADELCPTRCEARSEAGSQGGPVRLLVFGRISHHSKMDLLPLLRALHRLVLAGMDPATVELVLAGWVDDGDDFLPTLRDLAANVGIPLTIAARPSEAEKVALFRSADIFISIADNPQETFGITLLEAGAFGLPVVASDYDGYRDIVVQDETGLLVPTIGPDSTPDADLLAPLTYDNQYHLLLAQRTVVEIPPLAAALKTLIESPDTRRAMGAAARQRVLDHYTWAGVIKQYAALWDGLWREPADPAPLRTMHHPLAMPYGTLFGHYPTRTLDPATLVRAGATGEAFYRGRDFPMLYSGLAGTIDPDAARKLVFLARKSVDTSTLIRKLVEAVPGMDQDSATVHILWSLKHDILERI
ncbi:MAG: glycosyltransferase family 4 protein [Pseudodesulfovibrio sp.]|uniref:Glycosyl transferase group 1 n=1 Tax=Pseudodesulfovibrio aespoeensis (strain ATCC 700646 / DSM 10631 / Aspo-2) TaxID=643562 RepID=E6VSB1_PSEA9|nr:MULTISPECIES: glycosyltransferase family 4 protein [Pseudodesulfovibrio]MBU4191795.1 glycosyltransferase family 4 protein [Pseudomonadota bacterium]ADU64254.1 glycosyl transferase group 1 [Pseudodesulfovibrio aespoeensis Aspo-2]MBU4243001.1 glycosyltransferase family 4 protein [Pseudomonadota bacterium]MBU4380304.1 glycosyltransferase family 4 protein [Pseudomonadota bacterium]MBU4475601.1 glycosyltransferase family 4 protein [Pseudomonadota bacterium]